MNEVINPNAIRKEIFEKGSTNPIHPITDVLAVEGLEESLERTNNIRNGMGNGSLIQNEYNNELKNPRALGFGSVAFGGYRGDKGEFNLPDEEDRTTIAEGIQSYAFGAGLYSHDNWTFTANKDNDAHQRSSTAFGGGNTAGNPDGDRNAYSFAFCAGGHDNRAVGYGSLVGGGQNVVGDSYGFAMGQKNRTADKWSATFGYNNDNAGQRSTIINGQNMFVYQGADDCLLAGANHEAYNKRQTLLGLGNFSRTDDATVCGRYNKRNDNALFIVGNGTGIGSYRSNAFVALQDGHCEVGRTLTDNDSELSIVDKKYLLAKIDELKNLLRSIGINI